MLQAAGFKMRTQRIKLPFSEAASKATYTERFKPSSDVSRTPLNFSATQSVICSSTNADKKDEHFISSISSKPEQSEFEATEEHQAKKLKTDAHC